MQPRRVPSFTGVYIKARLIAGGVVVLELLEGAMQMIPLIQRMTHREATLGVTDTQRFLAYAPGKTLDFGLKVGDPIRDGSSAHAAMQSDQIVQIEMPATIYGVRFLAFGMALRDKQGKVVGALVAGIPLLLEDELVHMACELAGAMAQMRATFGEIASVAEHTSQAATTLSAAASQLEQHVQSTDTIANEIGRVAAQTRMLGLNAAISAAHAGKDGAAFGVVAKEIQTLAERSVKAAAQVQATLADLERQGDGVSQQTHDLQAMSEELSAAVEETLATINAMVTMAGRLEQLAKRAAS